MMLLRGIEPKYFKLVMDTRIPVSPPTNSQWVVLPDFSRGKTNHWINPQLFQGCTQVNYISASVSSPTPTPPISLLKNAIKLQP
jgi:hypothetical protein